MYGGPIEGPFNLWLYTTTDTITTVLTSAYFSDGGKRGMQVGDVVWVINQTSPLTAPATQCQVISVGSQNLGGTLTQPTSATVQQTGLSTIGLLDNPRNIVDGGDFGTNPWQGGTSFNGGTGTTLTADRWNMTGGTGSSWSVSKQANTNVAGFSQALQWGRSSTDTHTTGLTLGSVVETTDSIRLQGIPVSLSFWAQAGANFAAGASGGTFSAILVSGLGTDDTFANLTAGSWTTASNVISAAVTPTTSAVRYGPFSGVVPAACTQLGLVFTYTPAAGTTAGAAETIQLMGVQVEAGGMTTFEHLDVAEVLSICQRYFVQLNEGTTGVISGTGLATSTTTVQLYLALPSTMRKNPTVSITVGGFQVTNGGGAGVAISGAGSAAVQHTPQAVGVLATVASGLTLGQGSLLVGRTTGNGKIAVNADY